MSTTSGKLFGVMGVFEYSPKENRLHFHALMQIPEGQIPGEIEVVKDYSKKTRYNANKA